MRMCDLRSAFSKQGFQIKLICMMLPMILLGPILARATSTADEIAALKARKNDAIFKVQDIVNQPITHLRRTPDMDDIGYYQDGWFHPGFITPDFDHVDVRASQELVYLGHKYVTSPANPGEVFLSTELEFNSMTKCFYTDRLLPKKKLSEDEMLEINQLYRVIGHCDDQLHDLDNLDPPLTRIHAWITTHKPAVVAVAGVLVVTLIFIRKRRAPEFQN
jgi:hypothetical protein